MDIKEYRKAIRALLKESKEKANQTYVNRDGSTIKLTPTQMKHRVEYNKKQRDPETRLRSGRVSDDISLQKARGGKPAGRKVHKARRGVTHELVPKRRNPEKYKEALQTKDRARKQTVDGKYPEKRVGGHKVDEARKEAWYHAFESILLEFDPRHDTMRRPISRRRDGREAEDAQLSAGIAASNAEEKSLRKSRNANNRANRKAGKKGGNLSTKTQRDAWAKKEANRARNRVGGTTGQQHDNTFNPEKSPELRKAEIKQRAREQKAKKGDK